MTLQASEIIRRKRDGAALPAEQIGAFVRGLVDGSWSDSQAAALAMAILLRGMNRDETVALTLAMRDSGEVLDWPAQGFDAPVLDKHSTGGVGDKVSLMLAPMLAACGALVPMVSGRGLGHTGGTLDKLEALPGYRCDPDRATLLATLRDAGCAIVGAGAALAPADRRLYAIRDVTATVESVPLITASILSKKLAAGLQGLVLDVKVGAGAFMTGIGEARALATSLVDVARGAGLPATALITDMNQVLGWNAGNGLETLEAIRFLTGEAAEPRLLEVTLALGAELLMTSRMAADERAAHGLLQRALDSGEAAERFARMVARLSGPADVLRAPHLAAAPVQRPVGAPHAGRVTAIDVRALGLAIIALGGGRVRAGEPVDPRVGLADCIALGAPVDRDQTLAVVHAADDAGAAAAAAMLRGAITIGDPASQAAGDVVVERVA